jgi:signal transduction histidine kinase
MSHDMSLALFRVMQEALGNVARHAQSAHASVTVSLDGQGVTLTVTDDGVGISAAARRKSGRFGLSGMRARCEALGGNLRVAAAKPVGACVRARLPWSAARPGLFTLGSLHVFSA